MNQRTAALNLEWSWIQNGFWYADLPTIPGYTYKTDPPCARVLPVYGATGKRKDEWKLNMGFNTIVDGGVQLTNSSFGIPNTETAEEMMQAVDNLSVEEISQTLADHDYYAYFPDEPEYHHDGYFDTLSGEWIEARKGARAKHATRRTASLDLDWHNPSEDTWQADLPAIPGYTGADGNDSFVTVVYNGETELAVPYDAVATIFLSQGGVVNLNLWDMWSFDPFGPDAKDVMQAVDDLDATDLSHQLESMGYEPMVDEDGYYVVASRKPRHATRRGASMALDWVGMGDVYVATLPAVPGYQGSYPDEVRVASRPKDDDVWLFEMLIGVGDNQVPLYNYDFGIPYGGSAEEMMTAVENLDPQEIADVLATQGYMPDED